MYILRGVSECMRHLTYTYREDCIHHVGDDVYLDIQRYHLEVACRGFSAMGPGQGRLGNKSAEISLYIYASLQKTRGTGPIARLPIDI